jgi:hypothetical protein|tara:strand:+ start:539 stop:958 length:420 start_codon:yes stop_codon:yes gene_type:complete
MAEKTVNIKGKNYALVALTMALLVSLGINISPEDTHFCADLEIGKYCDRLSGTSKTCYPAPATRAGSKLCSSKWVEIQQQATEEEPIIEGSPETVTGNSNTIIVSGNGKGWICELDGTEAKSETKCYSGKAQAYLGELV